MFSLIKVQHQGIDVCINNAGLALPESLEWQNQWLEDYDGCKSQNKYVFPF